MFQVPFPTASPSLARTHVRNEQYNTNIHPSKAEKLAPHLLQLINKVSTSSMNAAVKCNFESSSLALVDCPLLNLVVKCGAYPNIYKTTPENLKDTGGMSTFSKRLLPLDSPASATTEKRLKYEISESKSNCNMSLDEVSVLSRKQVADENKERFQDLLRTFIEKYESVDDIDAKDIKDLSLATATLYSQKLVNEIQVDDLIQLFPILDQQIQNGLLIRLLEEDHSVLYDKVFRGVESSIVVLSIMAVPDVDRRLLNEELIQNILYFYQHILEKIIFPIMDLSKIDTTTSSTSTTSDGFLKSSSNSNSFESIPLTTFESEEGSQSQKKRKKNMDSNKKKPSQAFTKRFSKEIVSILPRVLEFLSKLNAVVNAVKLEDPFILQLSNTCLSTYLLEGTNPQVLSNQMVIRNLQMHSMNLLRSIFIKYKSHRELLLQEILTLFGKIPTSKRNLRNYNLRGDLGRIQMISSLVLCMLQSVIHDTDDLAEEPTIYSKYCNQLQKLSSYSRMFISSFLKRCIKKDVDLDYRTLLVNFTEDLLTALPSPEYPVVENLLVVLSTSLANVLASKNVDAQYSLMALSLLGKICVHLRKQIKDLRVYSFEKDMRMQSVLKEFQEKDMKTLKIEANVPFTFYQIILSYLKKCSQSEPFIEDARKSCLAWFLSHIERKSTFNNSLSLQEQNEEQKEASDEASEEASEASEMKKLLEEQWLEGRSSYRQDELSGSNPNTINKIYLCLLTDQNNHRGIFAAFNKLLGQIMSLLNEGKATFRARVIKCLNAIVDVDPILMTDESVRKAVKRCFMDEGISVRQASVDLVGRYMLENPELVDNYFDIVVERLMDKGVSVRKSVVKILREMLLHQPEQKRCSEAMRKIVGRIGDPSEEDSIKNLIVDTFRDVWFTSTNGIGVPTTNSMELPSGWKEVKSFQSHHPKTSLSRDQEPSSPSSRSSHPSQASEETSFEETSFEEEASSSEPLVSQKAPSLLDIKTPSKGGKNSTNTTMESSFLSPDGRVFTSLNQVWSFVTPEDKKKKLAEEMSIMKTAITIIDVVYQFQNTVWLVDLIQGLLEDEKKNNVQRKKDNHEDDQDDENPNFNSHNTTNNDNKGLKIYLRCQEIVNCVVEQLLLVEEGNTIQDLAVTASADQLYACLSTLSVFCSANPTLLSRHFQPLAIYLKGDNHVGPALEAKILHKVSTMMDLMIRSMEKVDRNFVLQMEGDLEALVFKAPPSVLVPCLKCMVTISEVVTLDYTKVLTLIHKFYSYILRFIKHESLVQIPDNVNASLQRALFATGLIVKYLDLEAIQSRNSQSQHPFYTTTLAAASSGATNTKQDIVEEIYQSMTTFLVKPGGIQLVSKSVKSIGFMIMRQPRLLLAMQQEGHLKKLLLNSSPEIQIQTLYSLSDILREEEKRLEKGTAKSDMNSRKSKSQQVQGDQEAEASLIGSVMQVELDNLLFLCFSKATKIRKESVVLIGLVVVQGLVNPVQCVPTLVALLTDPLESIHESVYLHLARLNEKFPGILNTPVIQGIRQSYSFQIQTKGGSASAWSVSKEGDKKSAFGSLYRDSLRKTIRTRSMFLKSLLTMFTEKGSILSTVSFMKNSKKKSITTTTTSSSSSCKKDSIVEVKEVCDFLNYIAQVIFSLPFDAQEEPLYIIYHINRFVSLRLGSILESLKEIFIQAGMNPWKHDAVDIELSVYPIQSLKNIKNTVEATWQDEMKRLSLGGFSLCILLRLKSLLKTLFVLDDNRCQTFVPQDTTKVDESALTILEEQVDYQQLVLPEISDVPLYLDFWNVYLVMWKAMRDDQQAIDFSLEKSDKKLKTRKRRTKKQQNQDILPDEDDGYF